MQLRALCYIPVAVLAAAWLLAGCGAEGGGGAAGEGAAPQGPTLFAERAAAETGVAFENRLAESPRLNILSYLYYYNGGGVAVGDVVGDSLPDLYFTANEGPNRLYVNRGGFLFEDVTDSAGVAGTGDWTTGVAMADVNGDGHRDLYVCVASGYEGLKGKNQLYVNNGDGTFTEKAEAYGLDFAGYSTHAAFFDYDRDGDLDVYLLNHSTHGERTYGPASQREEPHARAGDRLFRNDGSGGSSSDDDDGNAPQFTDVTEEAGLYSSKIGYGLGVATSDLNGDGWPDIYVANDFHENDYLYYNNGDGTFTEALEAVTGHTSLSSMGVDAADFSGDGRPDLATLDMLPRQEAVRKTSVAAQAYDVYQIKRRYGYAPQFARNALQLNQGVPQSEGVAQGEGVPQQGGTPRGHARFSEIGALAGVEATDWSWAPLFADLDHDGWQDLFVSNGIFRRPNDLDYIKYTSGRAIQQSLEAGITKENLRLLKRMPKVPVPNYAFRNEGDLTFSNRAAAWGLAQEGFSNGAAYGDLDGDGDLDLVTNNLGARASLYENRADSLRPGAHSLTVRLEGAGANTDGIGATVRLRSGGRRQMREQYLSRGFQSSVDPKLHFGLGGAARADSLTVTWPDGRVETRTGVAAGQTLTLRQEDARPPSGGAPSGGALPEETPPLFEDITEALALDYRHEENAFVDFNREYLMPHKLSTEGPALAVADVNGDGLDDVYAGGAKQQPGRLFIQQRGGTFRAASIEAFRADSLHEDTDAVFFDADADGDPDLYVASGGNEFEGDAEALSDRLYLNEGPEESGGNAPVRFRRAAGALPKDMHAQGAVAAPADFDADGDTDLFVGSRVVAGAYGRTPRSYLLENDGTGHFTDVTDEIAPGLARAGMVTSAAWIGTGGSNTNGNAGGNARPDLVVVGEWMPIRIFRQGADGRFTEGTEAAGLGRSNGWWTALHAEDMDGDGDEDLVAGNLGLNGTLEAAPEEPARLYLSDFDDNGSLDPIITYYRDGMPYPLASQDALFEQVDALRKKYPTYESFGARQIEEIFPEEKVEAAEVKEAYTFATSYAENQGDGTFRLRPLPTRAQLAPVHGIQTGDLDRDGHADLVLAGGFYGVKPVRGRFDASYGHFLRGDGRGEFEAVPPAQSGLWLEGQIRALRWLERAGGTRLLVAARNDAPLQVVRVRPPGGEDKTEDETLAGR